MGKLRIPEKVKIRGIKIERETEKALQVTVPTIKSYGGAGTFKIWLPKSQVEIEIKTIETLTLNGRKNVDQTNVIAPNWLISRKEDDINDFFESKGREGYTSIAAVAI